jgi:GntR family transcriptional regulator/MocR family aminotransferase
VADKPLGDKPAGDAAFRRAGAALWTTRLDRGSAVPLARQLAEALRQAIADGRLAAAARLPSTRALAAELGIARSTVVTVFEQLVAEGFINARRGAGYFVPAHAAAPRRTAAEAPAGNRKLSRQAGLLADLPPPRRGEPRPFELGFAEIDGRFVTSWKRLAARALSGRSRIGWFYGDPKGEHRLRQAIADYLAAARGVRCEAEQVVLTAGTQQGLSLAIRLLLDPGEEAWVEDPCYRAALDILRAAEARIVPVPVDANGLDIAAGPRDGAPRLVYVTPSHQFPLGMAMPLPRRVELLDWAERTGAWIIEDDYDSEFQYQGRALPSLQGLDRGGRVLYLGTFSKLLFPSLRLGYAVLPADLADLYAACRHLADRQSSALVQAIMTDFILEGHFARHLKRMRELYGARQGFLVDLLRRRLAGRIEVGPAERGMHAIAWLPPGQSDRAIAAALAAAEVAAAPVSGFTLGTPRPPGLILGYTGHVEPAMARAVDRMARVLEHPVQPPGEHPAEPLGSGLPLPTTTCY